MAVSDLLTLTVPLLLAGVGLCGVLTGTAVFSALTDGARDGLKTVMRIFPALVALLTAVSMLRASGALEALTRLCAPVLAWLGIPPETAMLLLVRPISGSGALAMVSAFFVKPTLNYVNYIDFRVLEKLLHFCLLC